MENILQKTRQEILDICDKKHTWTGKEVKSAVSSMKSLKQGCVYGNADITDARVKVGDITTCLGHPCVIFKVTKTHVYCLVLTTEVGCDAILEACESRFYPNSYITFTITSVRLEKVVIKGIYDNHKHLIHIRKMLKGHLKSTLKI